MSDVGVLDKVMAVLGTFADGADRHDPAEVARRVGITTPTAYRLMRAMAEHGLLGVDGRRFGLGPRLIGLGALAADGVEPRTAALPLMTSLRDTTGETVELQVLSGHHRVPVEMVPGSRAVRTTGQVGLPLPLHAGASSRVLLAPLDPARALDLAERSATEHPDVPWSRETFAARLAEVVERGWETSSGERDSEFAAVAAPVHDRDHHVVAVLVLSTTSTRFADPDYRLFTTEQTVAHAEAITRVLAGGPGPVEHGESVA